MIEFSVVAPCYNEEKGLPEFVLRTTAVLDKLGMTYELILVDDGSRDQTLATAISLKQKYPCIKVVGLARNFGHQAAVTAGMDLAEGKAVVLIDADLQDPPEVILEMVPKWREGFDVVYAQRRQREGESQFKLLTAKIFYRLLRKMTDANIPVDTGDFRLMDRNVVDAIKNMREKHRFIRGMVSWVGFKQTPVLYDRKSRHAGETNYPLKKMVLFAMDAITSFSIIPLRLVTILGLIMMSITAALGLLVIAVRLLLPTYFIPGFGMIVLLILFFGGLQLFALGVIGEYVGRIYEEIKRRPLYLIKTIL
jgi:glycosyltransferase involved in cell wall biosynthesis